MAVFLKQTRVELEKSWTQVMQKFFSVFISFIFALKVRLQILKFDFVRLSWDRTIVIHGTMDKLAVNWQNFARAELQLKFTLGMRL